MPLVREEQTTISGSAGDISGSDGFLAVFSGSSAVVSSIVNMTSGSTNNFIYQSGSNVVVDFGTYP